MRHRLNDLPQTSKACEVQASVGSNPTATASRNAGKVRQGRPGVLRLRGAYGVTGDRGPESGTPA